MNDLVQLLEDASFAVSSAAVKASDPKLQRRLVIAGLTLRNLAIALRRGTVVVPDAAIAICTKELGETLQAANAAKNDAGYGRVLYEALEAIDTVERHLMSAGAASASAGSNFAAMGIDSLVDMQGYTPLPPDLFPPRWPRWPLPPRNWPFPWPPRPFPPSPWPPGPPPWLDARNWEIGGY